MVLIVVIFTLSEVLSKPAKGAKKNKGEKGLSEINKDVKSADVEARLRKPKKIGGKWVQSETKEEIVEIKNLLKFIRRKLAKRMGVRDTSLFLKTSKFFKLLFILDPLH